MQVEPFETIIRCRIFPSRVKVVRIVSPFRMLDTASIMTFSDSSVKTSISSEVNHFLGPLLLSQVCAADPSETQYF
jgi:hypothetical protein